MTQLKAYEVRDNHEGYCAIAFATNGATARREGASKLDIEWEDVESCTRKPEFDAYAPGPVPPLTLIAHGWWFECQHCSRRVSNEMAQELEDDSLDPADFVPRPAGKRGVFCSASCESAAHMAQRDKAEAEAALLELIDAKFPGVTVIDLHVYGTKLEASQPGQGTLCSVIFTFPGAHYTSRWIFGEPHVHVPPIDHDAWHAHRKAAP